MVLVLGAKQANLIEIAGVVKAADSNLTKDKGLVFRSHDRLFHVIKVKLRSKKSHNITIEIFILNKG